MLILSVVGVPFAVGVASAATTYTINGTVTDSEGSAVGSATVTVTDGNGTEVASTTTDSSGAYSVDVSGSGDYTVEVSKTGYTTAGQTVSVSSNTTVDLSITERVITGKVTDLDGNGVANLSVKAVYQSGTYEAKTASDGSYTITGVPEGTPTVEVAIPTERDYTFADSYSDRTPTLTSNTATKTLDFTVATDSDGDGTADVNDAVPEYGWHYYEWMGVRDDRSPHTYYVDINVKNDTDVQVGWSTYYTDGWGPYEQLNATVTADDGLVATREPDPANVSYWYADVHGPEPAEVGVIYESQVETVQRPANETPGHVYVTYEEAAAPTVIVEAYNNSSGEWTEAVVSYGHAVKGSSDDPATVKVDLGDYSGEEYTEYRVLVTDGEPSEVGVAADSGGGGGLVGDGGDGGGGVPLPVVVGGVGLIVALVAVMIAGGRNGY